MSLKLPDLLRGQDLPQPRGSLFATCGERAAIWGVGKTRNRLAMTLEPADFYSLGRIPECDWIGNAGHSFAVACGSHGRPGPAPELVQCLALLCVPQSGRIAGRNQSFPVRGKGHGGHRIKLFEDFLEIGACV